MFIRKIPKSYSQYCVSLSAIILCNFNGKKVNIHKSIDKQFTNTIATYYCCDYVYLCPQGGVLG